MENTQQYKLKVPGMHCAGCIRTVEAALKRVPGTVRVRVDYLRKEATVEGSAGLERWLNELQTVGYPAQVISEGGQ